MTAIQFSRFGDGDVLEYVDLPLPSPQNEDILIEVTAAGVNYPDIRERQGVYQRAGTHVGGVTYRECREFRRSAGWPRSARMATKPDRQEGRRDCSLAGAMHNS
jgi:hypothetical protein